jgi:type 1 glutamine amidotransferase
MKRTLVLSGGPGHDFESTTSVIAELSVDAGFDCEVVTEPSELFARLHWAEGGEVEPWDLVTVNALRWRMDTGRYAHLREALAVELEALDAEVLLRHVVGGGGLLVLHTGVICFDAQPTWHRLVGASWSWERSSHPPAAEVDVTVTDAGRRHPVTAGLESFRVHDEVYGFLDEVADLEPLLTSTHGGTTHPLVWARVHGAGRVLTDVLGHSSESMTQPSHRALLARALSWTCRT